VGIREPEEASEAPLFSFKIDLYLAQKGVLEWPLPPPARMDYKEPKTRKELKGRDKQGSATPYSQKHIRLQEALAEKRQNKLPPASKKGSKG
jgi:hypothetical protein